eukprot:CAMPEP_0171214774 /NCGR_PEP_ID=MMETSP0790-20130122/31331_1 /TAXON_ID=2925 /ORGANISM="Alexandrium catenella, Strain OF101" /LENGTH=409 /DNA_ID=CAMNT_0011680519 /DNA_START=185 /DNA_END=1414 /DNA_ORIENTATION=+
MEHHFDERGMPKAWLLAQEGVEARGVQPPLPVVDVYNHLRVFIGWECGAHSPERCPARALRCSGRLVLQPAKVIATLGALDVPVQAGQVHAVQVPPGPGGARVVAHPAFCEAVEPDKVLQAISPAPHVQREAVRGLEVAPPQHRHSRGGVIVLPLSPRLRLLVALRGQVEDVRLSNVCRVPPCRVFRSWKEVNIMQRHLVKLLPRPVEEVKTSIEQRASVEWQAIPGLLDNQELPPPQPPRPCQPIEQRVQARDELLQVAAAILERQLLAERDDDCEAEVAGSAERRHGPPEILRRHALRNDWSAIGSVLLLLLLGLAAPHLVDLRLLLLSRDRVLGRSTLELVPSPATPLALAVAKDRQLALATPQHCARRMAGPARTCIRIPGPSGLILLLNTLASLLALWPAELLV